MEKLWQIRELGMDLVGKDMIKEPIPIRPGMHYIMGGIKTDIDGLTNIPRVYAAGECANVSVCFNTTHNIVHTWPYWNRLFNHIFTYQIHA
jgi:succinate dehydrogenase/fumarate reductase flavoprotein subunit